MDNPVSHEAFRLETVSIRLNRDSPIYSRHRICNPQDAVDVVGDLLCEMDREVVCVINLKANGIPINCHFASMGAIDHAVTHPRELFKASILSNAASMMLVHCHPSGNLHPSTADIQMTDRMIQLADLIGIPLLDHVIVGGDNHHYFSFREKGMVENPIQEYARSIEELKFKVSYMKEGIEMGYFEMKDYDKAVELLKCYQKVFSDTQGCEEESSVLEKAAAIIADEKVRQEDAEIHSQITIESEEGNYKEPACRESVRRSRRRR